MIEIDRSDVRVSKIRSVMPKLNIIPANDALDDDEIMKATRYNQRPPISLSPSPSPLPIDPIDPEIDPDNVVVRGSYTDDEGDDDD